MYQQLAIRAEVIAFAVTHPWRMTINEILIRPTAQPQLAWPVPCPGGEVAEGCRPMNDREALKVLVLP